jgi:hypothetical protein
VIDREETLVAAARYVPNIQFLSIFLGSARGPGRNVSTGATERPIKYPSLHVCDCIKISYPCSGKANELAIWHAIV